LYTAGLRQRDAEQIKVCLRVFAAALALAKHLGMQTCLSQDRPGFVVNRMLLPLINEAFFLLMEVIPPSCNQRQASENPGASSAWAWYS
jgi:hypothetical protein